MRPPLRRCTAALRPVRVGWALSLAVALAVIPAIPVRAIPLSDADSLEKRRLGPQSTRTELRRLRRLEATLTQLVRRAERAQGDLRLAYERSIANLRRARRALAAAHSLKIGSWTPPRGIEAGLATASGSAKRPAALDDVLPVVASDDFYLHCMVRYPKAWVARKRKVRLRWYLFDERHLPAAIALQRANKAIYYRYGYETAITTRRMHHYQRISGLALLPGRYFIAVHIEAAAGAPAPEQVSLGAFRVVRRPASGVRLVLPHYAGWYRSYNAALRLQEVGAKVRGRSLIVNATIRRATKQRIRASYVEVVAESGYRRVVLYRDRLRTQRGRLELQIRKHRLVAGPYQLRVTVFAEVGRSRSVVRGCADFKRVRLTVP